MPSRSGRRPRRRGVLQLELRHDTRRIDGRFDRRIDGAGRRRGRGVPGRDRPGHRWKREAVHRDPPRPRVVRLRGRGVLLRRRRHRVRLGEPAEAGRGLVGQDRRARPPTRRAFWSRRPTDPSKFNGTVLVEWLNDTAGIDADPGLRLSGTLELLRSGFAYVGVSAQAAGGGRRRALDRSRVATPLVQVGPSSATGPCTIRATTTPTTSTRRPREHSGTRAPSTPRRPQGRAPHRRRRVAVRHSHGHVRRRDPARQQGVFDGFFIHSRFSGGALLNGFADAGVGAILAGPSPARIRGISTCRSSSSRPRRTSPAWPPGSPAWGSSVSRQPDTALLRTWEIAGTSHADQYLLDYEAGSGLGDSGAGDSGISTATALGCGTLNEGPAALGRGRCAQRPGDVDDGRPASAPAALRSSLPTRATR